MGGRHVQQVNPTYLVCPACRLEGCKSCVDVLLANVGRAGIDCKCQRQEHQGLLSEAQERGRQRIGYA